VYELSIALQKAQAQDIEAAEQRLSNIDDLDNIIKTLDEIGKLILEGRDGRAKTIMRDLIAFVPVEENFDTITALLRERKWEESKQAVDTLKAKYTSEKEALSQADPSKIILAVDDRPEILTFVKNALKDKYKLIAVRSGDAALRALNAQTPNIFLLDIDMPEMSGLELAAEIRKNPKYTSTPLIFLTGNSQKENVAAAMKLKCNDFIVKPTTNETLTTKIAKQFENGWNR
jgi:CheY-like chemotaxis protein